MYGADPSTMPVAVSVLVESTDRAMPKSVSFAHTGRSGGVADMAGSWSPRACRPDAAGHAESGGGASRMFPGFTSR